MKKKCFIFDLDGVIVDTAKYHYQAWKSLANELGIDFSVEQNEQLKGVSRVDSLKKILKWAGRTLDPNEFQNKMNQKNANYIEYISDMNTSELLPDVDRVLKFLTNNNQYITLGSASKNARPILDKVKITGLFDAIVDGNDVSKAKPNPEVFLKAARLTKSKTKNCVVFEDSVAGIQAANAAGMISIGIGDSKVLHEAQYNFKDFKVMSNDFLEQLINNHNIL
jgi:beta-phosphoglucomutase